MAKIVFSKKERRIIIVLMIINCFALFTNYFKISPKIKIGDYKSGIEIYVFTDSKEPHLLSFANGNYSLNGMYWFRNQEYFWPFTKFIDESRYQSGKDITRFRGLFPDFDHSEFIVYSILIFGIFIIKKLW